MAGGTFGAEAIETIGAWAPTSQPASANGATDERTTAPIRAAAVCMKDI
jgi:hypothetical protein